MDIDEEIARLTVAVAGAQQALAEARTPEERYEAAMDVRVAEERLSWFLHQNGADE